MSGFVRVMMLMQQNRFDLALSEVEGLLAESPDSSYVHCLRSLCRSALGQNKQAEEAARTAISLNPEEDFAFYALSRALHEQKDHRGALAAIEKALELDPDQADYWRQKAFIQFSRHQWNDAVASTDRALAINAEDAEALVLRSHALHALGRTREADEMSRQALAIQPDLAMGHFEQGWALLRMGKARVAEERFLEALRIDANFTPAQEGLKEAIRSRFAPYRWITGYQHWLRRFPPKVSVGILLLAMFLVNILPKWVPERSAWHGPATMVVYAYLLFAFLTWITRPLSNLFLRLHPLGKFAMTPAERYGSLVLGAVFVGAGLVATGLFIDPVLYWPAVMMSLAMAVPGAAIFVQEREGNRWLMALVATVLLLMGPMALILVSLVDITKQSPLFGPTLWGVKNFWLGVGISTWISAGMSTRE
jgi:tetratricopeptide (TPR) repeat protein